MLASQGYKNPNNERLKKSTKWVDNRCLAKKEFRQILEREGSELNNNFLAEAVCNMALSGKT